MSFVERSYPMQQFVLANLTDVDSSWKIPGDHTKLNISIIGCCRAVGSDQERGEMEAQKCLYMKFQLQFMFNLTLPAAAQGSCQCCIHKTWLGSAACKSTLVLGSRTQTISESISIQKKTAADFNHHPWHCRGVISKTAWELVSIYFSGANPSLCAQVCRAAQAGVYSAVGPILQENTCACWTVDAVFGNGVQKHLRMPSHQELQH